MAATTSKDDGLLSQSEARAEARRLNTAGTPKGLVAVATTYPESAWGGHERGWQVVYRPLS